MKHTEPPTRRWLDFADVSMTVHLDGTFRARLLVRGPRVAGVDLRGFSGRWVVGRGLVVAATSLSQRPVDEAEHSVPVDGRGVGIGVLGELA